MSTPLSWHKSDGFHGDGLGFRGIDFDRQNIIKSQKAYYILILHVQLIYGNAPPRTSVRIQTPDAMGPHVVHVLYPPHKYQIQPSGT